MGRRILNRKDLRADYDAAEARRKQDDEETDTDTEDEEEDDEEEGAEGEDAEAEDGEEGEDEDEEVPVKKKKKPAKEAKPKVAKGKKVVRMKVVWVVYNNSNQKVAVFDYPKKKEAEEHAAKLKTDKNQTFFVQPVKEAIE